MNVLILSDGHHNVMARALRDVFSEHGDDCEIVDSLALITDILSQERHRARSAGRRFSPRLSGGAFRSSELILEDENTRELLHLAAGDLGQFLSQNEFDLILCMHALSAFMVTAAVKKYHIDTRVVIAEKAGKRAARTPAAERLRGELQSAGLSAVLSVDKPEEAYEELRALAAGEREKAEETADEPPAAPVKLKAPSVQSVLRHQILKMPEETYEASGIIVNGRRLKSFVFSTDLAIIRNCDADAVFAVYPFTPQQAISDAIIKGAFVPVFCGVGGGTTKGPRTVSLAKDVESQGAMGVVLNAPISNPNLRAVALSVDIPVVITVVSADTNIARRLESGASIINVAGAADTPDIVRKIRAEFPDIPIIASGGSTGESIRETIRAGANAVTYTPPSTKDLFRVTMSKYREV